MFPSVEDTDEKLIAELVDGGRSVTQAGRVLDELGTACREAAAELEALMQVCVRVLVFCADFQAFFLKILINISGARPRANREERKHTRAPGYLMCVRVLVFCGRRFFKTL